MSRQFTLVNLCILAAIALVPVSSAKCQDLFGNSPFAGSAEENAAQEKIEVGIDGYCPVCIVEMKSWVRGQEDIFADVDGKRYFFPSTKEREMFTSNIAKYVPALGGDCVVCYAEMGERVPGSVQHAVLHNKRLYLFPGADQKKMFMASPNKFQEVDLAIGGECTVCRHEMGKMMPGKPEFSVLWKGLNYRFPGDKQRSMFLADPEKYEVK